MLKHYQKYAVVLLALFCCSFSHMSAETPLESFQEKYPGVIYQDIVINKRIYPIGTDICDARYKLLKPILETFNQPFTVLDLGAAQGYFSFRTAQDFPQSSCVMVEADHTAYYSKHGSMLYDLCSMNRNLKNIFYLERRMDLVDLAYLNREEHFDIVFAFLVVHLMDLKIKEQIKIVDSLLNIGDNLILEVANDVDVVHTAYVESLSHSLDCTYLGEVKRHKDPTSTSTGKFFWFKRKSNGPATNRKNRQSAPIKKETFAHLNGVYPKNFASTSDN